MTTTPAVAGAGTTQDPQQAGRQQVQRLAHEFDAMLMTQMLREMRKSMLSDEDGQGGLGNCTMTDTMDVELGQALTRAGGFGLTPVLLSAFDKQLPAASAGAPTSMATPASVPVPVPVPVSAPVDTTSPGGPVTSGFGWRKDPLTGAARFHKGIDVAQPVGTDVISAGAGKVVEAGTQGGYGTTIVIDHGNGRQTRYAHLSAAGVAVGQSVESGQVIGKTGNSGRSTGPHLHFEVTQDGRPVDPASL